MGLREGTQLSRIVVRGKVRKEILFLVDLSRLLQTD